MKKIGTFLALLCVLNLVALAGLFGYLFATGRLDKAKAQAIADMLKHQGTPEKLREQVADILAPTTAPATGPSTGPASHPALAGGAGEAVASAQDRIDFTAQAMEHERLRLENVAQDLRHRQELLAAVQEDVELKLKKIEEDKKAFDAAMAKANNKGNDENFQKSLALYAELKPKQIKDIFLGMQQDMVVKYLGAMEPDQAAKIIGEFKTPDEQKIMAGILDKLRTGGTDSASGIPTASSLPLIAPRPFGARVAI